MRIIVRIKIKVSIFKAKPTKIAAVMLWFVVNLLSLLLCLDLTKQQTHAIKTKTFVICFRFLLVLF